MSTGDYNWTTPDLCDEYSETLEIVEPLFRNFGGLSRFGGEIATVKCFEDNSMVKEQLRLPGGGRVLVVDGGGSNRCALLGDQLAELAIQNGWAGVVIHGSIRDVEMIQEMPLGVQAVGAIPIKSVKKNRGDLDIPVRFGGVCFQPGYYLYADDNGIIVSPKKIV